MTPSQRAIFGIKAGDDAADAKRVQSAAVQNRRGLRAFAVLVSSGIHLIRRGIILAPNQLTGIKRKTGGRLVFILP